MCVDCAVEGGHRVYPAAFRPGRVNAFAAPNGRVDEMSIALRFPNSNPTNGDVVHSIQLVFLRDL